MLVTLNALASYQSKATEQMAEDAVKFLNYCATHPNAVQRYSKSDMILTVHSHALYLSKSKARSCAGGFFYMGSKQCNAAHNGAILATTSIMRLRLEPSLKTARRQPSYVPRLKKWAGHNQPRQCKPTIQPHAALPTIQ
jgi:hypothetical protein